MAWPAGRRSGGLRPGHHHEAPPSQIRKHEFALGSVHAGADVFAAVDTAQETGGVVVEGLVVEHGQHATDTVLAAIGEMHPAKTVAKAARKARFQQRS